jgi:hypothetical protein
MFILFLFSIPDPGVKKAPDPGSGTLGRMYLGVVEMGGELHENGRDEGRHIVGEGLHKSAEAEHTRVVLQGQVLTHTYTNKWVKRLQQGHLHHKLEVPGMTCPGRESNPGLRGGRRALQKRAI